MYDLTLPSDVILTVDNIRPYIVDLRTGRILFY